jgi:uncharacterized membrane protein YcaP (DUF421 family)
MEKYQIHIDDLMRILQGNVPWEFYLELVIRALVSYAVIIVALRLMGKRMGKLLTRNEVAAVATLAAAIGIPLQTPDRGLLPGLLIAGLVVLFQRYIAHRASKKEQFERLTQGHISTLVTNSVLQIDAMKECHLSRERIFSLLRGHNIRHLGEVQRLYMEASGSFTFVPQPQPAPGLCVLPEIDTQFVDEQPADREKKVCSYCGIAQPQPEVTECRNCNHKKWVHPIS